jgi:hypothetical protein
MLGLLGVEFIVFSTLLNNKNKAKKTAMVEEIQPW